MRLENDLGILLRRFRDERGFSQEQLALQCGRFISYPLCTGVLADREDLFAVRLLRVVTLRVNAI